MNDARPRSKSSRQRGSLTPAAATALSQSACISTGLPIRGVITWSPTRASIHVSWSPGMPALSKPSASRLDPESRSRRVAADDRFNGPPQHPFVAGGDEIRC